MSQIWPRDLHGSGMSLFSKHFSQETIAWPSDVDNATARGKGHCGVGDGTTLHMVAEAGSGSQEQDG